MSLFGTDGPATPQEQIEAAVRQILIAIGENPDREGLKETPHRVAKMFKEIYAGVGRDVESLAKELNKVFEDEDDDEESTERFGDLVIVKNIPFYSTCEHHLVPFVGKAHVGYIPSGKVIGLSKIARLVDIVAKKPQLQERVGKEVLNTLVTMLQPEGVMVVIEAEHLCVSMRGIKKPGTVTVTSATYGAFRNDASTRNEFLNLIKGGNK